MEKLKVTVNENLQGEINGVVARQDGYVIASSPSTTSPGQTEIEAIMPSAALFDLSECLRAMSSGEGSFVAEFSHYQPVPDHLVREALSSPESLHP